MKKYIIAIFTVASFTAGWITYNWSNPSKKTNKTAQETLTLKTTTDSPTAVAQAAKSKQETNQVTISNNHQQPISIKTKNERSAAIDEIIQLDDIYVVSNNLIDAAHTAASSENQEALFQSINKMQENEIFSSLYLTHHQCDSNRCLISIEGLQNLTQENIQKLKQELLFGNVGSILPGKGGTFYFHEQNNVKSIRVVYDTTS
jgi:hypothetical protein